MDLRFVEEADEGAQMIVRTWSATTNREKDGQYRRTVEEVVLPRFERARGYRGALFLRKDLGSAWRYVVLTYWDSMEAVRALVGDDPTHAYVPAEIRATLDQCDETAEHFEVVIQHGTPGQGACCPTTGSS